MFAVDTAIDAIQNGKKSFVTSFVPNKAVATALNDWIDAQSEYTKLAVKSHQEMATRIATETTKLVQEAAKVDLTEIVDTMTKGFTTVQKSFEKATKA